MNTGKETETVIVKPVKLPYPLTKREKQAPIPVIPEREKEPVRV
jgi:hypothetical protein